LIQNIPRTFQRNGRWVKNRRLAINDTQLLSGR
jgi:hypothetical protein